MRYPIALAAAALLVPPAHANPSDIGMTSATKNEVIVVSGADRRGLKIGDRVFQDQNIRTGADSAAQLLFLDETALTVGPNSSLVLDKAVFDPDKKVGELSVRAVSGAFRFVSGSSPSANYTIKTPAGTIGVRGTWLALRVTGDLVEILVRNGAIRFCNEALQCTRVGAGYRIRASRNIVTPPIRASHETLESVVALWFGSGGDLSQLAPGAGSEGSTSESSYWWKVNLGPDFRPGDNRGPVPVSLPGDVPDTDPPKPPPVVNPPPVVKPPPVVNPPPLVKPPIFDTPPLPKPGFPPITNPGVGTPPGLATKQLPPGLNNRGPGFLPPGQLKKN